MREMRRHTPATEILFLSCQTQSEKKQNKNQLNKNNCTSRAAGTRRKRREISTSKKHPQTSSYKPQLLHALILTQTIAESGRPRVADSVVALHNLRQLSRMTTQKEQQIQQQKTSPNFILQGAAPSRFDSDADHRRERPPPRRRLGCCSAQLTSALTHDDGKRTAHSAAKNIPKLHLTRPRICTL
jgi:hypothetical protein